MATRDTPEQQQWRRLLRLLAGDLTADVVQRAAQLGLDFRAALATSGVMSESALADLLALR